MSYDFIKKMRKYIDWYSITFNPNYSKEFVNKLLVEIKPLINSGIYINTYIELDYYHSYLNESLRIQFFQ